MLLTKEKQQPPENTKIYYICRKKIENKYLKGKKYCKVRDCCHYIGQYRGAAHSMCNLKYSLPKKISIIFHNGSNYNNLFIVKEMAEELKKIIYFFRINHWKIHNLKNNW